MKRFCTNCGNEIAAGTAFCDNCGTPIKNVTVAESPGASRLLDARVDPDTQPRSGRSGRFLLIAGAATIAFAIAIGGVWWAAAKKSSEIAAKSDSAGSRTSDEGKNVQWVYVGTLQCPSKESDELKNASASFLSPYCSMAGKVYAGELRCKDSRVQAKCE